MLERVTEHRSAGKCGREKFQKSKPSYRIGNSVELLIDIIWILEFCKMTGFLIVSSHSLNIVLNVWSC